MKIDRLGTELVLQLASEWLLPMLPLAATGSHWLPLAATELAASCKNAIPQ